MKIAGWFRGELIRACLLAGFLACGALFTAALSAPAASANPNEGFWKIRIFGPDDSTETALIQLQAANDADGEGLRGVYASPWTGENPVTDGRLEGDRLRFSVTQTFGTRQFVTEFRAVYGGTMLRGTQERHFGRRSRSEDWTAYRVLPLVPDRIPNWPGRDAALLLGSPAVSREAFARGQVLYQKNCMNCHQWNGQGIPGVFPPLAGADYLMNDRERAIRILCEGLFGEITVNGREYSGVMPAMVLDDQEVADVLTYVGSHWSNGGGPVGASEVARVRATTRFPSFESLQRDTYAELPTPPAGFTLREVVQLPDNGVRMASDGRGERIYVLCELGDVWRIEPRTGRLVKVLEADDYMERRPGDLTRRSSDVVGMALDPDGRMYIASNQQNDATLPVQNNVTIYRTTRTDPDGDPAAPEPWFEVSYPGNSAYMHGVEHLAFGPDGMLYVGNGARTDGGEAVTRSGRYAPGRYFDGGETELTACIWRLDPRMSPPELTVSARGLRNPYGFCWNRAGEMFATDNGPDADAPEELNLIEEGRHYGFPYAFSDWTRKAYSHTPDPPEGLEFAVPIPNLGPDGGYDGAPLFTFDPHSSPGGIVYLGDDFPDGYRDTFLTTRYGNMIGTDRDVGFDLLRIQLTKDSRGRYQARVDTILKPLGHPVDVHLAGVGKVYICEYSRATSNTISSSLPGRILEFSWNGATAPPLTAGERDVPTEIPARPAGSRISGIVHPAVDGLGSLNQGYGHVTTRNSGPVFHGCTVQAYRSGGVFGSC